MTEIYSPEEDSFLLSEVLKTKIPSLLKKNPEVKVLEIGAGSGIQLQTLKNLGVSKPNIFAVDINPDAVKYCKKLGFNCIHSNLFQNVQGKYNLIIFNSPYLPDDKLEPEDSKIATTGGKHGSEIINKFLQQAKSFLTKDGKIFLLTSSLTKKISWTNYKKTKLAKKKFFFEELFVWEVWK